MYTSLYSVFRLNLLLTLFGCDLSLLGPAGECKELECPFKHSLDDVKNTLHTSVSLWFVFSVF
jgi:hypothetical protein